MAKFELDTTTPLTLGELIAAAEVNGGSSTRWRSLAELLGRRLPEASPDEVLALPMSEISRLMDEFIAKVLTPGVQAMGQVERGH